ncbi:alpha/beta hydrolase [Nocardioides sp.]|uniref:alpha/beta hydrolase n=1 Tax=Nocardioides sp. TaxID=35761 RepID=UPI002715ACA7|nr:alpha/beta fold hydrolase [Nocardioides sp.]MDO9458405.1 alpha/beta fold hydrolase [Nocardioides sp.]
MPETPPPDDLGSSHESFVRLDAEQQRALVLVLHGGKQSSRQPVDGRSASWKRMAAMQRAITPDLHAQGVGTWLLRYRVRGWNGGAPVVDARWALDEVRRELGEVPVVLLGHSMGARTAAYVADDPSVVGVVGLAPWWMPDDPVDALRDKRVLAAHGRTDKITSARATRAYLRRAEAVASEVAFRDMGRVGHYMLRRVPRWNAVAGTACLSLLV